MTHRNALATPPAKPFAGDGRPWVKYTGPLGHKKYKVGQMRWMAEELLGDVVDADD